MPDFIPKVGERVHLFYMLGDGSYGTIGTVKAVDGDRVQIEETEYEHWDWDQKTRTGKFVPVPFKCNRWQTSATRWFECQRENHPDYNMFKAIEDGPGDNVGIEMLVEYELKCQISKEALEKYMKDNPPKIKAVEAIFWTSRMLKAIICALILCFIGVFVVYLYLHQ
jgi:hypothetical protein